MRVPFVDLFDLRQDPDRKIGALVGLGLAGFATWALRGLITKLLQTGVDPAVAEEFKWFFSRAFAPDSLLFAVSYWAVFVIVLAAICSLVRKDSVMVGLYALAMTAEQIGMNYVFSRMRGQPVSSLWPGVLFDLVEDVIFMGTLVVLFRLTQRIVVTFVLGMPAAVLLGGMWRQLTQLGMDLRIGLGLPNAERAYLDLFFSLSGAVVLFVPALMLWAGHAIDRRLRGRTMEAAWLPNAGPMSRRMFVGGLATILALTLVCAMFAFGFLAMRTPRLAVVALVPLFALAIVDAVLVAMMVHRMWKAIPSDRARTTPGRAAGLLFVPFFNLYWVFQAVAGFATDWNNSQSGERNAVRRLPRALFIALPVLALVLAIPTTLVGRLPSERMVPLAVVWLTLLGMTVAFLWAIACSVVCDAVNLASGAVVPERKATAARPAASALTWGFAASGNSSLMAGLHDAFGIAGMTQRGLLHATAGQLSDDARRAREASVAFPAKVWLGGNSEEIASLHEALDRIAAGITSEAHVAFAAVEGKHRDSLQRVYNVILEEAVKQGILPFRLYLTDDSVAARALLARFETIESTLPHDGAPARV